MRKKIAVLGSTGSIGKNTLAVAAADPDRFEIVGLTVKENIELLEEQIRRHAPSVVAVLDKGKALTLQSRVPGVKVLGGPEGICEVAALQDVDLVVAAMVGAAGIAPTMCAVQKGKVIALANKEVLVSAGERVMPAVLASGAKLIPVDSEHNALYQCLEGEDPKTVRRLILTGSGGPFREKSLEELRGVSVEDALRHPNFSMGKKITVDSSTLMNKGLEVIEAYWLFGIPLEAIEVVIHPEQKIHGLVEFIDGSILAQMAEPDMSVPIRYAMSYPERIPGTLPPYDFIRNGKLQFFRPDTSIFRCLYLAYEALKARGTTPAYMNGANEILVERFLRGEIIWAEITEKLERLLHRYVSEPASSLEVIFAADEQGRREAFAI